MAKEDLRVKKIIPLFFFFMTCWCISLSAQAQPLVGTWEILPAGSWKETLAGGGEGPGNVIQAFSPGYYLFDGAVLTEAEEIGLCDEDPSSVKYFTTYQGGTLTLGNLPDNPWSNSRDPHTRFQVILESTTVETCKYPGTRQSSFSLSSRGKFADYPGYEAIVSARYDKGFPQVEPGDPIVISGELSQARISISPPVMVDIKPGSCPNPINVKSRGVLPVAILGSAALDVGRIDPNSVLLEGVPALRSEIADVVRPLDHPVDNRNPFDCLGYYQTDGIKDLSLKFDTQKVVEALGIDNLENREVLPLELTFSLKDGTECHGEDVVVILKNGRFVRKAILRKP